MKKSNMYEFVDVKWNPLAGECQHGCIYCSTNRFTKYPEVKKKYSGKPRIDEKQLKNLGKNKTIFVCAQNDLFANNVSDRIIIRIIEHCKKFNNKYIFQTKNPERFIHFDFPKESIFCVTIESNIDYDIYKYSVPKIADRANSAYAFYPMMVTIEPILDFDLNKLIDLIKIIRPFQVNIGADSGNNNLNEPSKEKVLSLISELKEFTVVHQKENLKRLLK